MLNITSLLWDAPAHLPFSFRILSSQNALTSFHASRTKSPSSLCSHILIPESWLNTSLLFSFYQLIQSLLRNFLDWSRVESTINLQCFHFRVFYLVVVSDNKTVAFDTDHRLNLWLKSLVSLIKWIALKLINLVLYSCLWHDKNSGNQYHFHIQESFGNKLTRKNQQDHILTEI